MSEATLSAPETSDIDMRGQDDGFTLLELLVVIAILGLLVAFVVPAALRQLGGAKVSVAKQNITSIGSVLDLYKLDVGNYPTSDQGLAALNTKPADVANWNGPYAKGGQLANDPWNHPWIYHIPSSRDGKEYDLCSSGPDGKASDPADPAAICN
jgi:general secretion pathway protein G